MAVTPDRLGFMDLVGSYNATGAVNQQERLDAYIAGFVDGEGSFHVALQRNPCTRVGFQLVPEFRVSHDVCRKEILDLIREHFDCGSLRENHKNSIGDNTFVFVVRRRRDLLDKVLPFFEKNPLLSRKQREVICFADIVRRMDAGEHLTAGGFERLAAQALRMNGGEKYRRLQGDSVSRILRDHMPGIASFGGEDMVRSAWRHAEPDRNVLALSVGRSA